MEKNFYKNTSYKKSLEHEAELFQRLNNKLPENLSEELDQYVTAANAARTHALHLTYLQGMKDMLALLRILS